MNRYFWFVVLLFLRFSCLWAQDDMIDSLLTDEVIIENPVYKPVIGLGSGVFNFYGDVRNNYLSPVLGDFGYKFNVTTYIDDPHFFKLNLYVLLGSMTGNERSLSDPLRNLNFKTDVVNFGVNLEYSFEHIFPKKSFILPFVSAGLENIQFTPKGDLKDAGGNIYHYWSDGTIRNIPETNSDVAVSEILYRDYVYETDLRTREKDEFNLGQYGKNTFSFPVDAGLNFKISNRVSCKLATSFHFTFTDFMDNVSARGTSVKGRKGNDFFSYNYFTLHFDLFSEPETEIVEKMFAEMEFDEVMYDDEDGDFILDAVDECPGTPYGVEVDTLGCPLDTDQDGIPDYLDKEKNTPPGSWVDADGRQLTEEEFLTRLLQREEAMNREELKEYFDIIGRGFTRKAITEIPEKFRQLDADNDNYISFNELLQAIDMYFDYQLNFTVEDIYELNSLFFSQ